METVMFHWFPGEFPAHKGQWRRALMFSLIGVGLNGWINNRKAGDLKHYRAHYDVTVMFNHVRNRNPWSSERKPFFWHHMALQWRHYKRNGVSNHQPHDCLLNRLFMRRSKKTTKLRVTGPLCWEITCHRRIPLTNVFNWWRHHGLIFPCCSFALVPFALTGNGIYGFHVHLLFENLLITWW